MDANTSNPTDSSRPSSQHNRGRRPTALQSRSVAPVPAAFTQPAIPFRERVKAAEARALKDRADGRRTLDRTCYPELDDDEFDFVCKTFHLPGDVDRNLYVDAWMRFRQHLAMPRIRNYAAALAVMLTQPEVLTCLLGRWLVPVAGTGPRPAYSGSKAVMLVQAALGISPHVNDAYAKVEEGETADICAAALDLAAEMAGDTKRQPFRLASVENVHRHFRKLSAALGRKAVEANVQMLRSLAALFPNLPICHVAGIDGTAVAAWAPQRGGRTEADEAKLRTRAAHAGFRFYERNGSRKRNVTDGQKVDVRKIKFWRGYHLVVLVDYCTGRPIVWTLVDASHDEARTLHELLAMLYEFWPDCPLETIVADGAWDKRWAHKLCETQYGVHLVASRSIPKRLNAVHEVPERESDTIAYFDGRGQAFCRAHGKPMRLRGHEFPSRDGLLPGQPAPEAKFRARFVCKDGCGSPGLQVRRHWSALAYYPHHPVGQQERYAERHALLAHRNVCESLFNALKVGHGIATSGADRLRLTDYDTVATLVDLSFCMGTALMLGHEREQLAVAQLAA